MKAYYLFAAITLVSFDSLAQWDVNGVHISNSNSGNVGIGTASPSSKLEVRGGDILLKGATNDAGDLKFQTFEGIQLGRIFTSTTGVPVLNFSLGDNNPKLTIHNSGNVGIGTAQPAGVLHLFGGNSNGAVPSLVIGGGVSGNNINDLYVLDSKNLNLGVGYAARVIGLNIQNQTDDSNGIVQRTVWGGVTGASAIYLGADDVHQGHFGVLTSPQGSSTGTVLTERLTVRGNGNVGIGTTSPGAKLEVVGSTNTAALVLGVENLIAFKRIDGALVYGMGHSNGEFTIGKTPFLGATAGTPMNIASGGTFIRFTQGTNERMRIATGGNVGIGTTTPDSKLTVKGTIHAEEVKVDLNVPGPDYVFEEDYPLTSLEDTKAYIHQHKHLPGIPSSAEMQQNGVNLLEMNMKLLEKVEELTLHLIKTTEMNLQQQKEIDYLKSKIDD